ncbi:MAG: nucleoside recognition domain-containing protein [Bacteroidales bacterium]|nr:nucleoside recognition domain-containing protein [Bacteroidales bacterium]MDX9797668.1 nucleoside recognition domain-containing protein [Bacteroidales bacterium]
MMIPVSIIIKILQETNAMPFISQVFEPLMYPLGLPPEMSLVWATAMLSNIYGGILALSSIYANNPLSVAQMTTLTTLILFAHTLLIEIPICKKAGTKILPIFLIRVVGGYVFALILNLIYTSLGAYQEQVSIPLLTQNDISFGGWALSEIKKYVVIAIIVLFLIITLDVLERIKVIDLINKLLYPIIKLLGISEKVLPLTLIGMTLGLAYGGGLIITESKQKDIPPKDIFLSLALLSLFHSIIEDSLLMIGLGASWTGIFLYRFIVSILAMFLIVKLVNKLPIRFFMKTPKE